jgi:aminoglycoside phosphotransferase (APT) family kinase protein
VTHAMSAPPEPERLRAWLRANIPDVPDEAIRIERLRGGASNVTMAVRIGSSAMVVRRPPAGAFLPSANDVEREYRFYSALQDTPVPTPAPRAFCHDPSVIGAPFYVMDLLAGLVPHRPDDLAGMTASETRALSEQFVQALAAIHSVDPVAVGLGSLGRPDGYLHRQVRRWTDQWRRTRELDTLAGDVAVDELATALARDVPESGPPAIVHGDYRLGNVMLDVSDRTRIIGILDWEMATVGDPLADVGYALLYWGTTGKPTFHASQACTDLPGFATGSQLIARYAELTGRVVDHVRFYVVLAAFKLSVIVAANLARARAQGAEIAPSDALADLARWALDVWHGRAEVAT